MFSSELRYLSAFLTLPVPDVGAAAEWYGAAFRFTPLAGDPGGSCSWLHMRRGEGQDMCSSGRAAASTCAPARCWQQSLARPPGGAVAQLAVDQELAKLADTARRQGALPVRQAATHWAAGEATALRDPYGNVWVFFARTPSGPTGAPPSANDRRRAGGAPLQRALTRRRAWRHFPTR